MDIISVHYKDIRKLFVSRSSNQGYQFSDDAFNDAFINCSLHFGNKTIDYDVAVKYFWIAYRNAIYCERSKTEKTILQDEFEDIVDETHDSGFAEYIYELFHIKRPPCFGFRFQSSHLRPSGALRPRQSHRQIHS